MMRVEDQFILHLNALCSEDEFGHHRWDVGLIKHDVSDTLQQRLDRSHAVYEHTLAQETVVKPQIYQSWAHLKHRLNTVMCIIRTSILCVLTC